MKTLYISVNVPSTHADVVRKALGDAGAGKVGNYSHTSFTVKGMGRSIALKGANPHTGEVDVYTPMEEEKIETTCDEQDLEKIVTAVKKVHPYEEPIIIVYSIELL